VLAGASLTGICRQWNADGVRTVTGRPWTAEVLTHFMRKPRNAGLRAYKGEIVGKGTWPPLVDESTWRAAQAVLDAPSRVPGRKAVRRHLLTGVALCGKCRHTLSGSYRTDGRIVYVCKHCHGVSILAENVEPMAYQIVAGRLAKSDATDLLKAEQHDTAEAEKLRTERATLLVELDNIGVERADGLLTGKQAKIATDRITEKLAGIEARQQDQDRLRVLDGIPLGKPGAAAAVNKLSPDRFRAVLDLLMTITVAPVGKSGKVFNPERVQVDWK
jgi:Recombinase